MTQIAVCLHNYFEKRKLATRTIGVQHGSDKYDFTCRLPNNKSIKLYYSNVFKCNVLGLCLSSAKSFIINKASWQLLKTHILEIRSFLSGDSQSKQSFKLANRKQVKLYTSPVFKENIISFEISDSKSFILNNTSWTFFENIFPTIDQFFNKNV